MRKWHEGTGHEKDLEEQSKWNNLQTKREQKYATHKKKGIRENETCIEREQRTKLHCKKNEMYWIAEGEKIRYVFFKYKELKF